MITKGTIKVFFIKILIPAFIYSDYIVNTMRFKKPSLKPKQAEPIDKKYFFTFDQLKANMIEDAKKRASDINKTPEEVEKKITEDIKEGKLEFPRLSHLYLLISNKTIEFLEKYKDIEDDLQKGYSNILYLINETQKYRPIIIEYGKPIPESLPWEVQDRETQTQHLFQNQEKLNRAMDHYVRQIEFLRTRRFEKKTLRTSYISATIAAVSAGLTVLIFCLSIYFKQLGLT